MVSSVTKVDHSPIFSTHYPWCWQRNHYDDELFIYHFKTFWLVHDGFTVNQTTVLL